MGGSDPDAPDRAHGRPRSWHRPSSLEEASALLAAAHAEGRRLRIGDDVTADGLNRVLEHDPGDLTCTVEAGVRLSTLREALAASGQRLSLDPPGDPAVGGVLAGNLSGPLRHRFGAPRDLVLGATLVLADGTVASSGGKVVKNVAGYDIARLVCGSEGRLALVARVSFRLHPLPKAARTLVVETENAAAVAGRLLAAQLQPSALDVLHPGRVAVLFEGSERAVGAQLAAAQALVGGAETDASVWDESRERQAAAGGRIRFAPGELAQTLARLSEAVVRPASGVAYTADPAPQGDSNASLRQVLDRIAAQFDPKGVLAA
jgi:glycolate oxidase FAD binding subunit